MPRSTQTMLVHVEVVESIEGALLRLGVASQDLGDRVADVQVKALEYLEKHAAPLTLEEWKKLCNKIAGAIGVDALRRKARRAKYEVDLCEDPDAYSAEIVTETLWDPVDRGRLMEVLGEQLEASTNAEEAFVLLDAEAANTKHAEIGEELGLSESAVAKRLWTMRDGFRRRIADAGLSELTPRRKHAPEARARNGTLLH